MFDHLHCFESAVSAFNDFMLNKKARLNDELFS